MSEQQSTLNRDATNKVSNTLARVTEIQASFGTERELAMYFQNPKVTWPDVLDKFEALSGQVKNLAHQLTGVAGTDVRFNRMVPVPNRVMDPREVDESLASLTDGRIQSFSAGMPPILLRSRDIFEVEEVTKKWSEAGDKLGSVNVDAWNEVYAEISRYSEQLRSEAARSKPIAEGKTFDKGATVAIASSLQLGTKLQPLSQRGLPAGWDAAFKQVAKPMVEKPPAKKRKTVDKRKNSTTSFSTAPSTPAINTSTAKDKPAAIDLTGTAANGTPKPATAANTPTDTGGTTPTGTGGNTPTPHTANNQATTPKAPGTSAPPTPAAGATTGAKATASTTVNANAIANAKANANTDTAATTAATTAAAAATAPAPAATAPAPAATAPATGAKPGKKSSLAAGSTPKGGTKTPAQSTTAATGAVANGSKAGVPVGASSAPAPAGPPTGAAANAINQAALANRKGSPVQLTASPAHPTAVPTPALSITASPTQQMALPVSGAVGATPATVGSTAAVPYPALTAGAGTTANTAATPASAAQVTPGGNPQQRAAFLENVERNLLQLVKHQASQEEDQATLKKRYEEIVTKYKQLAALANPTLETSAEQEKLRQEAHRISQEHLQIGEKLTATIASIARHRQARLRFTGGVGVPGTEATAQQRMAQQLQMQELQRQRLQQQQQLAQAQAHQAAQATSLQQQQQQHMIQAHQQAQAKTQLQATQNTDATQTAAQLQLQQKQQQQQQQLKIIMTTDPRLLPDHLRKVQLELFVQAEAKTRQIDFSTANPTVKEQLQKLAIHRQQTMMRNPLPTQ